MIYLFYDNILCLAYLVISRLFFNLMNNFSFIHGHLQYHVLYFSAMNWQQNTPHPHLRNHKQRQEDEHMLQTMGFREIEIEFRKRVSDLLWIEMYNEDALVIREYSQFIHVVLYCCSVFCFSGFLVWLTGQDI